MSLEHLVMISLFAIMMCADLTITHIHMRLFAKLKPRFWEEERNPIIRWIYKNFNDKVAFTLTLIYTLPWLCVLYYLFNKQTVYFIIASAVYMLTFVIHAFMSRYIRRELRYKIVLKDLGVDELGWDAAKEDNGKGYINGK